MGRRLTAEECKKRFERKWPEWELIEFSSASGHCRVRHKCGNLKNYEIYSNVEKRGPTCQECVSTKKWYWNVGDQVGDLTIINRRALPNMLQEYQYKCNACGFDCSKPVYIRGIAKIVIADKEQNPTKISIELARQYNVSLDSIIRWLKKAGIYDVKAERRNVGIKRSTPVYSPELNKAFRSIKLVSEELGIHSRTISAASDPNNSCQIHAGKHPVTGEYLSWERWSIEQYERWCKNNSQVDY